MEKDHSIRIAVRGFAGKERKRAIEKLLAFPEKIFEISKRPYWARKKYLLSPLRERMKYHITLTVRLTPEQYVELRTIAGGHKRVSAFVRAKLFPLSSLLESK